MTKHERELAQRLLSEIQRKWGSEGGKKGSAALTPAQRKRKASKAAKARWGRAGENELSNQASIGSSKK
jgi:hypothetical protein